MTKRIVVVLAAIIASAAVPAASGRLIPATRPALSRFRGGGGGAGSVVAKAPSLAVKVPTDDDSLPVKGILSVVGGTLLHMTLGTMYCWGSFIGYLPPSMRFFDGGAAGGRQPDALLCIPLLISSQMIAMPFGAKLNKKVGPSNAILIGTAVMNLGILYASTAKTLAAFLLGYAFLFGTGVGLSYTAPMQAGWGWFPKSKGLVNGMVLLGFGFGGFLFTLLGSRIANPDSLKLQANGLFPQAVYDAFPRMLQTLATCYAALGITAALLVSTKPAPVASASAQDDAGVKKVVITNDRTFSEALRHPTFFLLWILILLAAPAGLNVAAVYKTFALNSKALADDGFLSLAGGVATLFNGLGRVGWAALSDIVGFQRTFVALALTQVVTCLLYNTEYVQASRPVFLAITCAFLACMGGNFAMFPTACANTFGSTDGAAIYSVLFSAFGIASIAAVSLTKELQRKVGWTGVFRLFATMSATAAALSFLYKPLPPRAALR